MAEQNGNALRTYRFDGVVLDPASGSLTVNGAPRTLSSRPLEVLVYLIDNRSRVVGKQELFDNVWGGHFVTDGALAQVIKEIRAALEDDAHVPRYVRTAHRKGYQFIGVLEGDETLPGRKAARVRPRLVAGLAGAALLLLLAVTHGWRSPFFSDDTRPIRAVAVLPFEDHSRTANEAYFAAGLTEAVTAELSRLGNFRVISHTSAMKYAGTTKTLPDIAAELGVDAVVEGAVQRDGDRIRITASLIETATDSHLWTDTFEGRMADIMSLESEAARSLVGAIGSSLAPRPDPRTLHRPLDPAAYDAYLRAQMMQLEARGDARTVLEAAEKVLELDPSFAPGYAFASDLYGYLVLTTDVPDGNAYLRARELARKAVELDPNLAYARMALARVHYQFEWDWQAARAEFEKALALNPNDSQTLASYGVFHVLVYKDCDRGIALLESARDRDPFNPTMHLDLGVYNFHCRRPEESIRHLEQARKMIPSFHYLPMMIAWNHSLQGDHELAGSECDALLEEFGETFEHMLIGSCSWVYARAGRADMARDLFARLLNPPSTARVDPIAISWACMGLERYDCALDQLDKALQQRSSMMVYMQVAPAWDPIRKNARFKSIIGQMKFPQPGTDAITFGAG